MTSIEPQMVARTQTKQNYQPECFGYFLVLGKTPFLENKFSKNKIIIKIVLSRSGIPKYIERFDKKPLSITSCKIFNHWITYGYPSIFKIRISIES